MGNNNSDLTQTQFKQQWITKGQSSGQNLWQNKQKPTDIYAQYIINDDQIQNNAKLLNLRRKNTFIVEAFSIIKQGFSCQMDNHTKRILVEHTPQRLSSIQKVPYPDIFHLYDIFIHGYSQLSTAVGFFHVDPDQVGINLEYRAKVWLSNNFESNRINGAKISQSQMVAEIFNILQSVTDHSTSGKYPPISTYFRNQQPKTFSETITKFRQYVIDHEGGSVPNLLISLRDRNLQSPRVVSEQFNQSKVAAISQTKIQATNVTNPVTTSVNIKPTTTTNTYFNAVNTYPVETKVAQPYPANVFVSVPQQSVNKGEFISSISKPLVSQTFIAGPSVQPSNVTLRPTTSGNLVRTNSQSQDLNQFKIRLAPLNSQIRFAQSNNPAVSLPPPAQQQIALQLAQRPIFQQNSIQPRTLQVQPPPPQIIASSQPINNGIPKYAPPVSHLAYNQPVAQTRVVPLQVSATQNILQNLKGAPVVENKGDFVTTTSPLNYGQKDNRFQQQQRAISQTIQRIDGIKVAESEVQNVPAATSNTKSTALKGSQTIAWEDYTNKNDATKGLSNFGRAVPQSFDILNEKKVQTQLNSNKFTPETDGKSSAQFLALLSQIKSGIGQNSSYTENYSYSTLKSEGGQGSYNLGTNYEASKFTSTNYVSSNYQGGLDPQLHADLQKYRQ